MSRATRTLLLLYLVLLILPTPWAAAQGLPDVDADGVEDVLDNCSIISNADQADIDADRTGDVCECGDASGNGRVDIVDWAVLGRCAAGLGSCDPLCDVTDDAVCDGSDPGPLRGYLAGLVAKGDLLCPQRPLLSDLPIAPDEENPPVIEFDPLPPGFIRDDPLDYGTGDFTLDPGPDPRLPAIGGTAANSGEALDFVDSTTPVESTAPVVQRLDAWIIETAEGRYADVSLGPFLVRVLAAGSPTAVSGPPADVELFAPTWALEELQFVKTLNIGTDPASGGPLFSVSSVAIQDTGGTPIDQDGGFDLQYQPSACDEKAVLEYTKTGPLAPGMPPLNFPEISGCSDERCVLALTGWVSAHNNAWRAKQMIDFADQQDKYYRSFIWGQPGLKQNGLKATLESSPEYWFGGYAGYRFDAIDNGIGKLSSMMETLKTGGLTIDLSCPDAGSDPGNVCFTTEASAHHWIRSNIALCDGFFALENDDGDPITYWFRAHTLSHELMHHRDVDFVKDGQPRTRAVQDKHIHGHGNSCIFDVSTISFYGKTNVRELATYENLQQGNCKHREKAFGNNDTWAYFVTRIGDLVHRQILWSWPAPAQPTPQPPDCDQPGDEGCQCAVTLDFGEGSDPDGDYRIDRYCPDADNPLSCIKTKFNASDTVGVCVDCEELRGPGCECDGGRPCDQGSCFGDDTFGGGVGHCYVDPIPDWVCLADCKRLFNDDDAYCYHEALGGARCYDSGCSEPEAEACFLQGKTCRDSACVVECSSEQDCDALGYPPAFICSPQGRCAFPL
jgi:hypothetical protein